MLKIALVTLGDPQRLTGGYLYHLRVAELAPRHGAQIDFVSFPDRAFPLPLAWGGRVLQQVKALRARAILLDSICAGYLAPWLWLRPPKIPILAILHQGPGGIGQSWLRSRLQAGLDRLAYSKVSGFLVASQSLRDELPFPSHKMQVMAPGCDVSSAPSATVVDLRLGRQAAILCVANWARMKDIVSLLEAFDGLPEGLATLHLVGDEEADPPYRQSVLQRLQGLSHRVVRHGKKTRDEVAVLYGSADFLVLNSLRETYGTVYGEAMAKGLPVVGWRAGNLPHLARHEVEGLIVEPGDIGGLREALSRLATDLELRQRLGSAAQTRAAELPTWDQTTSSIVQAIREQLT